MHRMIVYLFILLTFICCTFADVIGYWPLDGDANDYSSAQNNGVIVGSDWEFVRNIARAKVLHLNSSYLQMPLLDGFCFPFTISLWFKDDGTTFPWASLINMQSVKIVRYGSLSGATFYCDGLSNQWCGNGGVSVFDGRWHHIAGTYDGNWMRYYVDGQLANQVAATGSIAAPTTELYVGTDPEQTGWANGFYDDIQIAGLALSDQQIEAVYEADFPEDQKSGFQQDKSLCSYVELLKGQQLDVWSSLDGEMLKSEGNVRVAFSCDGEAEDFPNVYYSAGNQNMLGYTKLTGSVRYTTTNTEVEAKKINIIITDANLIHLGCDGHPVIQQSVAQFVIKKDEWKIFEFDLTEITRSKVSTLAFYCYEGPPGYAHDFTLELKDLKFESADPQALVFDEKIYYKDRANDTEPWIYPVLSGSCGVAEFALNQTGNIEMAIAGNGGVSQIDVNQTVLGDALGLQSGFLLKDIADTNAPSMITATVSQAGDKVVFDGNSDGIDLDAVLTQSEDFMTVEGVVSDASGKDRTVTVYWALPVNRSDLIWSAGLDQAIDIAGQYSNYPNVELVNSKYPLASVTKSDLAGLSMAVDLAKPVIYRIGYNPAQQLFYIAFDFALVHEQNVHGQDLSQADFKFYIFSHDPAWKMRSAFERYYSISQDMFSSRQIPFGGWAVWRNATNVDTEMINSGLRYSWGGSFDSYQPCKDNGVLNLYYIEPEDYQMSMSDLSNPSNTRAIERLNLLADYNSAEMTLFQDLAYSNSLAVHMTVGGLSILGQTKQQFFADLSTSVSKSLFRDSVGFVDASIGYRLWIGENHIGASFACNLDPDIPFGKGWFNTEVSLKYQFQDVLAQTAIEPNGLALDCFLWNENYDLQPENFQYSDVALPHTFAELDIGADGIVSPTAVIPGSFTSIEWLKSLRESEEYGDKIIMVNAGRNHLPFAAKYIDIFGVESGFVAEPDYLRCVAYRKSITDLPYSVRSEWQSRYNLLYNIFHGQGHDPVLMTQLYPCSQLLAVAGWEPVTYVTNPNGKLKIERYGRWQEHYVVVHNPTDSNIVAELDFQADLLQLTNLTVVELLDSKSVILNGNTISFDISSLETLMLKITGTDLISPEPAVCVWTQQPIALDSQTISMAVEPCQDPSGVEYYFDCVDGLGNDSGWIEQNYYVDCNLTPGQKYEYTVQARDKIGNINGISQEVTAVTYSLADIDFNYNVNLIDFAMVANQVDSGICMADMENSDFESDVIALGQSSSTLPVGWQSMWGGCLIENLSLAQWQGRFTSEYKANNEQNSLTFGINGGIRQDLNDSLQFGDYEISIPVGVHNTASVSWVHVKFFAFDPQGTLAEVVLLDTYISENDAGTPLQQGLWNVLRLNCVIDDIPEGMILGLQIRGGYIDTDNVEIRSCFNLLDLNSDCYVDLGDISSIVEEWLFDPR